MIAGAMSERSARPRSQRHGAGISALLAAYREPRPTPELTVGTEEIPSDTLRAAGNVGGRHLQDVRSLATHPLFQAVVRGP